MAKEHKKHSWEDLIEDDGWLDGEEADEGESWVEETEKVQENWKGWFFEPEDPVVMKKRLAEREAQIKAERQAEAEIIYKLGVSRDSFLRQLDLSERPEQIGWVTARFWKMIAKGEAAANTMLHLRSNMKQALNFTIKIFFEYHGPASARVKGAKNLKELEEEHQKNLRKIRKDSDDYIRKLRDEARTCPSCKRDKPVSHSYCWSCQEERRRPILDPDDYCPECGKITSPKGTLCYSCSIFKPRTKKKRREDSCERCGTLISRRFGKFCWSCTNYYGL